MAPLKLTQLPEIGTDRLVRRTLAEDDKHEFFALRSNEHVNAFTERPKKINFTDTVAFIDCVIDGIKNGKWICWAISLKTDPVLSGTICLWNFSSDYKIAELGYELLPLHQNEGLMNEAVNCVTTYALEILKVKRIEAFSHKDNVSSRKLLKQNKFQPDPTKKDEENPDYVVYCLADS